jgi:hypothetical protein
LGGAALELDGETLFRPTWITWTWGAPPPAAHTLEPVGAPLRLEPWAEPLRERAHVRFEMPPAAPSRKGIAVYYRDRDGWSFLGADTAAAGVGADLVNLEEVALFRDGTPPEVALEITARGPRPSLAARIVDPGAGVTWRTLSMRVDGEPVLVEWDPDASRLRAHLRRDLAPGAHHVLVTAADRVGNTSAAERSFLIP